jgi:hypothetical protein
MGGYVTGRAEPDNVEAVSTIVAAVVVSMQIQSRAATSLAGRWAQQAAGLQRTPYCIASGMLVAMTFACDTLVALACLACKVALPLRSRFRTRVVVSHLLPGHGPTSLRLFVSLVHALSSFALTIRPSARPALGAATIGTCAVLAEVGEGLDLTATIAALFHRGVTLWT